MSFFNDGSINETATTGCSLTIVPNTNTYDVEIQRSDDGGSTYNTVALLLGSTLDLSGTSFLDPLPYTPQLFYYRAREVKTGFNPGAWFGPITKHVDRTNGGGIPSGPNVIDFADPGNVNKNGSFIPRSSIDTTPISSVVGKLQNSGDLGSTINDGLTRQVTGMFHKTSDDLDDVDDSIATFKRTTVNEKTGAGRGFTAIDSGNILNAANLDFSRSYTNKNGSWLARSAGDATALSTVVQFVQNTGHLGSAMQDSTARPVTGMFSKTFDDMDDLDDSISVYKRTTANEKTGAGRGFNTIDSGNRIKRGNGFDDGNYAAAAVNAAGTTLHSNVTDGTTRTVTGMFHKTSDDIDDVDDSIATFKRTTANEKTGAGRGFSAINSSNLLTTGVTDGSYIGGLSALSIARNPGAVFSEVCDQDPTVNWSDQGTGNIITRIAQSPGGYSSQGSGIFRFDGRTSSGASGYGYLIGKTLIPFNPRKLYKLVVRCQQSSGAGASNISYVGLSTRRQDGTVANNNGGNAYVVLAASVVASTMTEYVGWIRGASLAYTAGSPSFSTDPLNPSALQVDTAFISPLILVNYTGNGTGVFDLDYFQIFEYDEDATTRTYSALTTTGKLAQTVQLYDGVRYKNITKGGQENDARHNAHVTFSPPFQNTPMIRLSGGVLYEPGAMWGTSGSIDTNNSGSSAFSTTTRVYDDFVPLNQSSTGFTVRARLWQRGVITSRVADFDGSTATSVGSATTTNALTSAPAGNDSYTIRWHADFTATAFVGNSRTATYVLALEADATGTGAWVERNTYSYTVNDPDGTGPYTDTYSSEQDTVSVSGFNGSGKFRIKIKSVSTSGRGTNSLNVRGLVNATDGAYGVSYVTTVGDQFASKTPLTSDFVHWQALET